MSEMVERVAAVIDPEIWHPSNSLPAMEPTARRFWEDERRRSLARARRAIEAMREPTEGMMRNPGRNAAIWQAMITAALQE